MASSTSPSPIIIRDPDSGRFVTVRGAGALKGQLTIRKDIDLTKPIAAQVFGKRKKA